MCPVARAADPPPAVRHEKVGPGLARLYDEYLRQGVTEVVHDMAPGAQLYLLKVDNEVDLGNAEEYCIANGIDIINHSVGWFLVAFYDGTGVIDDIANEAYAHGILWVNSAGNSANTHYYATLTDTDGDRRHEFAPGDEALDFLANGDTTVEIAVSWDAYRMRSAATARAVRPVTVGPSRT